MIDECMIDGHDWDVISDGLGIPVKLMCNTCGELYDVVPIESDVKIVEAKCRANLFEAIDKAAGETLEQKLADPTQRDHLKALTMAWLRSQRALYDAISAKRAHDAGGNGH